MQNKISEGEHITSSGVLTIFACQGVLTKHVEWVVARVLGKVASFNWRPQPMLPGSFQTSFEWQGPVGVAAEIASGMHGWKQLRFEITEHQTAHSNGGRWLHTPSLGIFHSQIDAAGNNVLDEHRLGSIIAEAGGDPSVFARELGLALGTVWDEEVEPFRVAAADESTSAAGRWLERVQSS